MFTQVKQYIFLFFSCEWQLQIFIEDLYYKYNNSKFLKNIGLIMFCLIPLFALFVKFQNIYLICTFSLYIFLIPIPIFIYNSYKWTNTFLGYIEAFLFTAACTTLSFLLVSSYFCNDKESPYNTFIEFIISLFVILFPALHWIFFSTLANLKISTQVNAVLTLLTTILSNVFDLIIGLMSITSNSPSADINSLSIFTNFYIIYPSITCAITTIVCLAKQAWIKKYNDNNDIFSSCQNIYNIPLSLDSHKNTILANYLPIYSNDIPNIYPFAWYISDYVKIKEFNADELIIYIHTPDQLRLLNQKINQYSAMQATYVYIHDIYNDLYKAYKRGIHRNSRVLSELSTLGNSIIAANQLH